MIKNVNRAKHKDISYNTIRVLQQGRCCNIVLPAREGDLNSRKCCISPTECCGSTMWMFELSNTFWSIQQLTGNSEVERSSAKCCRMIPEEQCKRSAICSCHRCQKTMCPGNSDILKCPEPCTVPCRSCQRMEGCRGVDKGR